MEKDIYGSTELYPLDSFSVRKQDNIRSSYLLGRYGAIPYIMDGDLLGRKQEDM